ncbi:DUF2239 family protein [Arenibaculum pallidiluteum]|uniref:DUF2239 family protein n=1 Tax=Arenibaculum pallidiluteum TaxID=2812559 RepID=UPI002E2A59AA|nr:DUF2239 family protein [Arenibaculum pallidiluteum]
MTAVLSTPCTAFEGNRKLASGPLGEVVLAVKAASEAGPAGPLLVFDDGTGCVLDLDLRGTGAEVVARLSQDPPAPLLAQGQGMPSPAADAADTGTRGRGRPKLGVVGREVTLLPRHWDWLAAQPGGASVALRKLVDEARRTGDARRRQRVAQERAYRFMAAMAGDLPGFEEAARALFANEPAAFAQRTASWPEDLRRHAARLAFGLPPEESAG